MVFCKQEEHVLIVWHHPTPLRERGFQFQPQIRMVPTWNPVGSLEGETLYIYDIYDSVILCLYVYDCICIIMCTYLHIPRSGFIYRTGFQGLPNQHGLLGCQTPKHQNNKSVHNLNQQEDHTSRQTVQQLVFWKCLNLRFPYASCNKYNIPYIYIYICIHAEDHKCIHMETVWTSAASEIHLARRLLQQRSHHQYTFVSFLAHGFAGLCGNKAALGQCLKLSTSLPRGSVILSSFWGT